MINEKQYLISEEELKYLYDSVMATNSAKLYASRWIDEIKSKKLVQMLDKTTLQKHVDEFVENIDVDPDKYTDMKDIFIGKISGLIQPEANDQTKIMVEGLIEFLDIVKKGKDITTEQFAIKLLAKLQKLDKENAQREGKR